MSSGLHEDMDRDVRASLEPVINAFAQVCSRIDSNITSLKPEFNDVFMYATVYNIAVDPNYMYAEDGSHAVSELLYLRYQDMLSKYAKVLAARAGESHLARIRCWRKYKLAARWMRKAFDYLSRYFLHETGKNSKYPSLDEVAKAVFFNCCLKKAVSETRKAVFDLILASRSGQITVPWELLGEVNFNGSNTGNGAAAASSSSMQEGGCSIMSLCKDAVELFEMMSYSSQPSFFEDNFFQHYIRLLRSEHTRLAQVRVAEGGGALAFIQFASQTIKEERERAASILGSQSLVQRTIETLEGAIFDLPVVSELLFSSAQGVLSLMDNGGHFSDIADLFLLLKAKPQRLDPLASAFQKHVESSGRELVKKRGGSDSDLNPTECISELVTFHKQCVDIVSSTFHSHRAFTNVLKAALVTVISCGFEAKTKADGGSVAVISTSELLASHCHQVILGQDAGGTTRSGASSSSANGVDDALGDAITLLEFAGNKDIFLLHTRSLLARRLLSPSAPQYATSEKLLVSRLKLQFGHQFTHCLSGMLVDKEVALKLNETFQAQLITSCSAQPAFEFSALALKHGVWPTRGGGLEGLGLTNSSSSSGSTAPVEKVITLPPVLETEMKRFEQYHLQTASRKVLRWAHHLGTATLQCVFNQQLKDFTMTSFQALILLQFNHSHTVSFEELMAMGLTSDEVKHSTKGLLRIKLLVPSTTSRSALMVNERFSNPARKIQVPSGDVLVSVETSKKLQNVVVSDRKPIIQACVMKIMKGRRQLSHTDLINECMRQVGSQKMTIEAKTVTDAIRTLLEREFLERHPDNFNIYRYVA